MELLRHYLAKQTTPYNLYYVAECSAGNGAWKMQYFYMRCAVQCMNLDGVVHCFAATCLRFPCRLRATFSGAMYKTQDHWTISLGLQ